MTMRSARTWLNDCFSLIEMTRRLGLRKGPPDLGISSKRRFPLRRSPTPTFENLDNLLGARLGSRDWDWQRTLRFDKPFWDVVDNRRKLLYSRKSAADMLVTPVRRDPIPDRAALTTCRIFSRRRLRRGLMDAVLAQHPGGRVIGVTRDVESCARSFLKIKGTSVGSCNHWARPGRREISARDALRARVQYCCARARPTVAGKIHGAQDGRSE
jgi:hypothetical protein